MALLFTMLFVNVLCLPLLCKINNYADKNWFFFANLSMAVRQTRIANSSWSYLYFVTSSVLLFCHVTEAFFFSMIFLIYIYLNHMKSLPVHFLFTRLSIIAHPQLSVTYIWSKLFNSVCIDVLCLVFKGLFGCFDQSLLMMEEIQPHTSQINNPKYAVVIKKASFAWDQEMAIQNIGLMDIQITGQCRAITKSEYFVE